MIWLPERLTQKGLKEQFISTHSPFHGLWMSQARRSVMAPHPNTWTSAHGLHRNYTEIPNPSHVCWKKKTGLTTRQPTPPNADGSSLIQEFATGATTALVGKYLAPIYLLCHLLVFGGVGGAQGPGWGVSCIQLASATYSTPCGHLDVMWIWRISRKYARPFSVRWPQQSWNVTGFSRISGWRIVSVPVDGAIPQKSPDTN